MLCWEQQVNEGKRRVENTPLPGPPSLSVELYQVTDTMFSQ